MTKTEMIEAIRKACIKANPQIVKLERGCYVRAAKHSSPIQIDGDYALDIQNKELRTLRFCDNCPETQKFKIIEIIGRDIGLADVLMAIGDKGLVSLNIIRHIASFIWFLDKPMSEHRHFEWHLDQPLTLQSEETIRFIFNLLKND